MNCKGKNWECSNSCRGDENKERCKDFRNFEKSFPVCEKHCTLNCRTIVDFEPKEKNLCCCCCRFRFEIVDSNVEKFDFDSRVKILDY